MSRLVAAPEAERREGGRTCCSTSWRRALFHHLVRRRGEGRGRRREGEEKEWEESRENHREGEREGKGREEVRALKGRLKLKRV